MASVNQNIIVQKFGGSSLATPEQILSVAEKIASLAKSGKRLIVVTSAMGKTTDQLTQLAYKVSPHPHRREFDMLLSTGERISMALMAMALNDLDCPAISFTGSQAGIMTDGDFSNAIIQEIKPIRVEQALLENKTVVVAGFQGVDPQTKEVTTLGRGGSDTTAVAMAAHFQAERCDILKDVDGVFSADPCIVPNARLLESMSGDELYEFCFWGAKVLNYRSVDWARRFKVPLCIGRSDTFAIGTRVQYEPALEAANATGSAAPVGSTTVTAVGPATSSSRSLGVNSHKNVVQISVAGLDEVEGLHALHELVQHRDLALPQVLMRHFDKGTLLLTLAVDGDAKANFVEALSHSSKIRLLKNNLSTVTTTFMGGKSQTLIVAQSEREACIQQQVTKHPELVST